MWSNYSIINEARQKQCINLLFWNLKNYSHLIINLKIESNVEYQTERKYLFIYLSFDGNKLKCERIFLIIKLLYLSAFYVIKELKEW